MSIQGLIDAATPGATVDVPLGVYNEQLIIDKPLTLQGPLPGIGIAIIDAAGLANVPTIQILSNDVIVRRLTIQDGPLHGIAAGSAAFPNLSNITISDNHIKGHGNAGILTNNSASMIIDNNIIENNGQGSGFNRVGIVLYPHGTTSVTNNIVVNNAIDGIFARASSSGLIIENNQIANHANSGISLVWDQRNTSIINNQIEECGTGNFDEEGGIVIIQSMAEVIQGNVIKNCKLSGIFWGWVPTTGSLPSEILISGNEIKNSSRDAIYLFSQGPGGFISPDLFPLEPVITGNNLQDSGRAGVYVSNVYYYGPGNANPTINDNQIVGNVWGVLNATSQVVDATNNWWGSSSGPFQPVLNPEGTGDQVSDNVNFIPWLTEPPIIQIIGCAVKNVSLENFDLSPLNNDISRVTLIIKVIGDVTINVGGNPVTKNFEIWFAKSLVLRAPQSSSITPAITATSICYATLNDGLIQVDVDLCIVINILGKCSLTIPSFGICPILGNSNSFGLRNDISTIKCGKSKINFIECINVEKVFDSCWFNKSLISYIDIRG